MRPKAHVIGDVGQTAVALTFKKWGWTANVVQSDYGEDLDCHVFVDQQRTPFYFRCQVKSSGDAAKHVRRKVSGDFSVRIAGALCREWLLAYFPVLIVVFDGSQDQAYWSNATDEVRSRLNDLGAKSLTLNVPAANVLGNSRDAIAALLSSYYAGLLKVQSEGVERTVFPLLMPRYRSLSRFDETNPFLQTCSTAMEVKQIGVYCDDLPTWTTGLRTLDGQRLSGLILKTSHADVASFSDLLVQTLADAAATVKIAPSEWFAFVCDPLRYSLEREGADVAPLQRNLTGWTSYAYVGGALVHDRDYAFRPPGDYVRQTGRRARSWDGYFYVSVAKDLAVQLIAGVCSSPGDITRSRSLRDHARAQYLPWRCQVSELAKLRKLLVQAELVFRTLEDLDQAEGSSWASGAICTPMFEPGIGLIPQANTWRELEQGSVQERIAAAGLISRIPGEPGDDELRERLAKTVRTIGQEPPEQWLVDGVTARPGLPLDLCDRRVIVQRMRAETAISAPLAESRLERLKDNLYALSMSEKPIETSLSYVDGLLDQIVVATAAWTPCLNESSAASLERATPAIIAAFDEVLSRKSGRTRLGTSIDVLRLVGELYFEGDKLY